MSHAQKAPITPAFFWIGLLALYLLLRCSYVSMLWVLHCQHELTYPLPLGVVEFCLNTDSLPNELLLLVRITLK